MGCGKTSVGRRLATLLSVPFIDLDDYIQGNTGKKIPELFAVSEAHFRAEEARCLREVIAGGGDLILALGGGAIMTPANADLISGYTTCIYLEASVETLLENLACSHERPLLKGQDMRSRIEELMQKRESTYRRYADITVDTNGKAPMPLAKEIVEILNKR